MQLSKKFASGGRNFEVTCINPYPANVENMVSSE